jgi:hypothetical protein
MKNIDKMGVYVLLSHLIITLAIIGVYAYTLVTGQGDETLKTILMVIIGYWFGSMGATALRKPEVEEKTVVTERVEEVKKGA